ncbi:hypothetical protein SNEBB_004758 [Seison nebaliae]|nr:hypothetical protein SNEBB_004758 [Seison nebaliae]
MANSWLIFGLTLIIHSAYSAARYRSYIRLTTESTEDENQSLPYDILLEAIIGLIIVIYGSMASSFRQFKSLNIASEFKGKTWDSTGNRLNFAHFSHYNQRAINIK